MLIINAMVILLTHEYPPFYGGVSTYCYEVAEAAHRLQLPLHVWTAGTAQPKDPSYVVRLNCGTKLHPWHIIQMAHAVWKQRNFLKGKMLILCSYGAHLALNLLAGFGLLPECHILSLIHGSEVGRFEKNVFRKFWSARLFKHVEKIFTPSQFTASLVKNSSLGKKFPEPTLASCAVGSWAAREVAEQSKPPQQDSRFRILTLARIHPRKGQLETAKCLALLPAELKAKIIYQIGGRGSASYLKEIESYCKAHDVAMEYLGAVSNERLAETYAGCDCYIQTSQTLPNSVEGFGISYLEAAWHGKPSISFRTGGVVEAIGEGGFIIEEGNLQSVADSVVALVRDAALYQQLSEKAHAHARIFSWENTAHILC